MEKLFLPPIFYIGQAFLMLFAGIQFFNIKIRTKAMIIITLCFGGIIWLVRYLYNFFDIPFGTHTAILIVAFFILIKIVCKVDFYYATGISLLSFCLVMLGGTLVGIIITFTPLSFNQVLNSSLLYITFSLLENSFLIVLIILSRLFNFSIDHE